MDNRTEIRRLYALEYKLTLESALRFCGVMVGSWLICLYTSNSFLLSWGIVFALTNLCVALFYRYLLRREPSLVATRFAQLLYFVTVASYIWMPLRLLLHPEEELTHVGIALILCLMAQFVYRSETSRLMIGGQFIVVVIAAVTVLWSLLHRAGNQITQSGLVIVWSAVLFYFLRTTLRLRDVIMTERASARMLAQNQKLAAVGQLAGGVAHDFNNILTAISGNFELYREVDDRDEKDELIEAAEHASARAAETVRQLMIYAGKSPTHFTWIDANAPLADLRRTSLNLVPSEINFTVRPLPRIVAILVDPGQMVLALLSLISNAADAVGQTGTIALDLRLEPVTVERTMASGAILPVGEYVVYTVTDDGPGIPDDIRASILNPFFTTKPTGKGTGLGLSMVVSIAESAAGGLEILSSEKGTVARIYVPAGLIPPDDDTPPHF